MRADCARCAALCCVAFAMDRGSSFAIDKPNGAPCPHLEEHQCGIYAERAEEGFHGCIAFDCLGAGQRVTQEVFGGRSWRRDPSIFTPMMLSFAAMREVHELLLLLQQAAKAPLSAEERDVLRALEQELDPAAGWSPESLTAFRRGSLPQRVRSFLVSLRPHFEGASPAREA